ncbi:MAG: hypothetical protein JRF31_09130 [Deltaproteobacteria bacterium]|nr:hypothetical protein [Deltaproteobacteria bacterium]MBW1959534.1 hypothetical protein [Deltaproteobacteria bacterium]MBW2013515.1 hypothetical protein [Deltaproteobacteria bacterium]MBW2089920.1 hypothetical protein [Deltaproteobacteria bacterium]MBW2320984.1 hypothetical protein [Deltaproteobacteria bacterium]
MEDLTVEEICRRINIQTNLNELQSKNKKKRNSALTTLATITQLTKRRDALYALCGYYFLEIEHIDDIELFFDAIRNLDSIELLKLILKDISEDRNIFRRRVFIDDFLRKLSTSVIKADEKDRNEIILLIENSVWGEKLKRKFLYHLDIEKF